MLRNENQLTYKTMDMPTSPAASGSSVLKHIRRGHYQISSCFTVKFFL